MVWSGAAGKVRFCMAGFGLSRFGFVWLGWAGTVRFVWVRFGGVRFGRRGKARKGQAVYGESC